MSHIYGYNILSIWQKLLVRSAIARALRKYYSEDQTLTPKEIEREDK